MILNKVKISGIFNLKDVEISLDDLSALIAPNNYGKSNVLQAIDFGIMYITTDCPLDARRVIKENGVKEVR